MQNVDERKGKTIVVVVLQRTLITWRYVIIHQRATADNFFNTQQPFL